MPFQSLELWSDPCDLRPSPSDPVPSNVVRVRDARGSTLVSSPRTSRAEEKVSGPPDWEVGNR